MDKILKYELQRTGFNIVVAILCLVTESFVCNMFTGFLVSIFTALDIIISCGLINLSFIICDKRIKKYIEENASDISLNDSQL